MYRAVQGGGVYRETGYYLPRVYRVYIYRVYIPGIYQGGYIPTMALRLPYPPWL